MKDSCRRQVVDYICSGEVLNGFGFLASIVSNSVLYLVLVVFLLGGGECYLVTVNFDSFSRRTCIPILLDEQRHLVGRFWANIRPFLCIFKAVCIFPYLPVSCFSLACCRAVCFSALVKILAGNI